MRARIRAPRLLAGTATAALLVILVLFVTPPADAGTSKIVLAPEREHAAAPVAQEGEGGAQGEQDVHAAEAEHQDEVEHEAELKAWYYWPAKWINFIALVALLYWMLVIPPPAVQEIFSFPGLRVIFAQRAAAIVEARKLAADQKEQAARMLTESEQRLAKIAEEVEALVSDARGDAEREQHRSREEGKAQAEKILQVANREVKHERVAAQRQLRAFVADLAVSLATTNLTEHLTADDQDRLIREYLSRLGQSMA